MTPDARKLLCAYFARYRWYSEQGYSLAVSGAQGNGKTTILGLLGEGAYLFLPQPKEAEFNCRRAPVVRYQRMAGLMRFLADFVPASERNEWDQTFDELIRCKVLLIDEFHVVANNDRAGSLLLDLIDQRISEKRPTHIALNARWDELRTDRFPKVLQQVREKLSGVTRELVIPGESRRTPWSFEGEK